MPFVISQDSTFTTSDDVDVRIASAKGSGDLRKRQFTMHIFINSGKGSKRDGYTALIGRGKLLLGKRFSPAVRAAWDKRVPFYFQKNAWVDTKVMEQL